MSGDVRRAVRADLERLRHLNIEAKRLRARLEQLHQAKTSLSIASIAHRHGVPITAVQALAGTMRWTEEEKPPPELCPYDAYHAR